MNVVDGIGLEDVAGYAAAVRARLADLGREQVEDLTDDLEVDLADALADERHAGHGASLVEQFGTPEVYAAELRAAAGLAPAQAAARTRLRDALGAPWRALVTVLRRLLGELRGLSWWAPVEGFLVALRPLWWVARGWVIFELVGRGTGLHGSQIVWVPRDLATGVLFVLCVVPSVQFGRAGDGCRVAGSAGWRCGPTWSPPSPSCR